MAGRHRSSLSGRRLAIGNQRRIFQGLPGDNPLRSSGRTLGVGCVGRHNGTGEAQGLGPIPAGCSAREGRLPLGLGFRDGRTARHSAPPTNASRLTMSRASPNDWMGYTPQQPGYSPAPVRGTIWKAPSNRSTRKAAASENRRRQFFAFASS
ncbi:MAG: hypothetical protein F4013_04605 [Gammaproteobacteria bacterium]|nr:hypothetical protein [Gammaproteobacteria bacterium]MYL00986.1 hypothetical protein [Gammaproteobacteria bacterium]